MASFYAMSSGRAPGESLFAAIMDDDRARAGKLLRQHPQLSMHTAEKAQFVPAITHWIYEKDTALHVAAAAHRVEIARMLLSAGADPNSSKNHRQGGPLHYAADGYLESDYWNPKRQVTMIHLLIEAGADPRAQDRNGATALHRAVRTRCAAAVRCLLDAGSDATIRNKPGSTAFHLAVQNTGRGGSGTEKAKAAQREIIRAFLDRGVSTSLRDKNGKSILEWARSGWISQILGEAV